MSTPDPYRLERFVTAQRRVYDRVIAELLRGRKSSHWMWFIFPQIAGLGTSHMAREYAIASRAEGQAYLEHPVLGARLAECARLVIEADKPSITEIFGSPDDLKFRSSMTLFAAVAPEPGLYEAALERYFGGEPDPLTLAKWGLDKRAPDKRGQTPGGV